MGEAFTSYEGGRGLLYVKAGRGWRWQPTGPQSTKESQPGQSRTVGRTITSQMDRKGEDHSLLGGGEGTAG